MNQRFKQLILVAITFSGWIVASGVALHSCEQKTVPEPPPLLPPSSNISLPRGELDGTDAGSSPLPASPAPTNPAGLESTSSAREDAVAHPTPTQLSSAEWHADRLLTELEQVMHLNESSRREVRAALIQQQQERYSRSIRFDEKIRSALGEQAADLEQRMIEREQLLRRRQQEQERSALAHQLRLSPEQEDQVGAVLDRVETLLAPSRATTERLIDEAMQRHQSPPTDRAPMDRTKLREAMTIIEQSQESLRTARKEALATELRAILSPEQYETWVSRSSEE